MKLHSAMFLNYVIRAFNTKHITDVCGKVNREGGNAEFVNRCVGTRGCCQQLTRPINL